MLTAEQFRSYPPEARKLAATQIELLRQLPESFLPLLLKELIAYDWKFPAERRELDKQFAYLAKPGNLERSMAPFEKLQIEPRLARTDFINAPAQFAEQLSAHLWATHQIDAFRAAAVDYVQSFNAAEPDAALPVPRAVVVVAGRGVAAGATPFCRKLRPHAVSYSNVQAENGLRAINEAVKKRSAAHAQTYAHWYIDGSGQPDVGAPTIPLAYDALAPVRTALTARIKASMESGKFDPEALRTMLAQAQPNPSVSTGDPVLDRFQLSLFTEGSGTQVFSTTFVQWSAREVLRRAQPLTLVARFTPRQRERPMNEMLNGSVGAALDPEGSLVDAEMGAYYTWLNQQRLPEADRATFLVWFEDHKEALAIGPSMKPGTVSSEPVALSALLDATLHQV